MTHVSCSICVYWRKLRADSCDWGECGKIVHLDEMNNETKAYVYGETLKTTFNTHETFYCSLFQLKQSTTKTIVDAAREAARMFTKKETKQ